MFDSLSDLLVLASFCGALSTLVGVGIIALPWRDEEMAQTTRALRTGFAWLDSRLRRAGEPASAPHVLHPQGVTLDPPTVSRAA